MNTIIGAGIGGASTAYFLRKLFGTNVGITIFEQSGRIGGRIQTIPFGGLLCETGASFYMSGNHYIQSFVREFGLELEKKDYTNNRVALYSGENPLIFSTLKTIAPIIFLQFMFHYKVELACLRFMTSVVLFNFSHIYPLQNSGRYYTTPVELFTDVNPWLLKMTKSTFRSWLIKEETLHGEMKNELAYGWLSNKYCQDFDVHALAGFAGFSTSVDNLNSVKGGNQQIPEKLIESALEQNPDGSPKQFVHAQVTSISPEEDGKYQIEYRPPETVETMKDSFDYVVIAAPLHQQSSIRGLGGLTLPTHQYLPMNTTLLTGDIKESVFGMNASSLRKKVCPFILPTLTGYTQRNCLFRSLSAIRNPNTNNFVWTAFSEPSRTPCPEQTLTSNYLNLVGDEKPTTVSWLAYPVYQPLTNPNVELGSFVLAPRLYYPNAIERVASCMEMAAIGGRNVALLIAAHRKDQSPLANGCSKS